MPPIVLDARRMPPTMYENVDVALARQYREVSEAAAVVTEASAREAGDSAASASAVGNFFLTLVEALSAAVNGDRFTTTDSVVKLRNAAGALTGLTNTDGVIRACIRDTGIADGYRHLWGTDPLSRPEIGASGVTSGASKTGLNDGMSNLAFATVQQFANRVSVYAPVSVTYWHNEAANGSNLLPAYNAAMAAIKAGEVPGRHLKIPPRAGRWTFSAKVVSDVSNILIDFHESIRLTATAPQHTLSFTADSSTENPATFLENVQLWFAEGVTIDGNGAGMDFPEPAAGTTPDYAALHCNTIKGLNIYGGHFTNGPMTSLALRRCPRHLLQRLTFTRSRWDNGFTASSDLVDYSTFDESTWGGGTLIDCVAYDNYDFGMTAFNVSGQRFVRCSSYRNGKVASIPGASGNGGGFSYEHAFGVETGEKDYRGRFENCRAFANGARGFYIDATGFVVDDDCETWGNTLRLGDTLDITGMGVVVSGTLRGYVGGRHHHNERCGVFLANTAAVNMRVELAGDFSDNAWHGARAQHVRDLRVSGKARFNGNGTDNTLHSNVYGHGLYRSGSAVGPYLGSVVIDTGAEFSGNAHRAIRIGECAKIGLRGAWGHDNFAFAGASSQPAILLEVADSAISEDCDFTCSNSRQTFVINFASTITIGRERDTRGSGSTGLVLHQAITRLSTKPSSASASEVWDVPILAPGATTAMAFTVAGVMALDFVEWSTPSGWGGRTLVDKSSSTDSITLTLKNDTAASIPASSVTVRVQATRATPRT